MACVIFLGYRLIFGCHCKRVHVYYIYMYMYVVYCTVKPPYFIIFFRPAEFMANTKPPLNYTNTDVYVYIIELMTPFLRKIYSPFRNRRVLIRKRVIIWVSTLYEISIVLIILCIKCPPCTCTYTYTYKMPTMYIYVYLYICPPCTCTYTELL